MNVIYKLNTMTENNSQGLKRLSTEQYFKEFESSEFKLYEETSKITEIKNNPVIKKKMRRALKIAWRNRDFEIKLFWSRAAYFWAFIASTFAGYFAILSSKEISKNQYYPLFELLVICLGLIFSCSWALVNLGSKSWQENWETHIDMLEDQFTGPIYKMVKKSDTSYSVSRINIAVSFAVFITWLIILLIFFFRYYLSFMSIIIVAITFAFILYLFFGTLSRTENNKKYFNRRIWTYENENDSNQTTS